MTHDADSLASWLPPGVGEYRIVENEGDESGKTCIVARKDGVAYMLIKHLRDGRRTFMAAVYGSIKIDDERVSAHAISGPGASPASELYAAEQEFHRKTRAKANG